MKPLAPLVAIFLAITPTAAAEDPEVGAGDHAFLAGIETVSAPEPAGTSSQATSSPVEYIYEPACERGSGAASDSFYGCGSQQSCGTDGLLFSVVAVSSEGSNPLGFTCIEPGQATPVDILTPGRILEAFERIPLPEAPLEVQPPGGVTLVNFDTILHTDAQPFTETVQLLNRQITFDIEPSEFTWTLGDGRTLTTTDPGRAWRAGLPMNEYVSHRYAEAGTVQLQLTTTWSARWRLPNGPWRPVAGTVDITSPPQDLEITTARPQLDSYD